MTATTETDMLRGRHRRCSPWHRTTNTPTNCSQRKLLANLLGESFVEEVVLVPTKERRRGLADVLAAAVIQLAHLEDLRRRREALREVEAHGCLRHCARGERTRETQREAHA